MNFGVVEWNRETGYMFVENMFVHSKDLFVRTNNELDGAVTGAAVS